MESIEEVSSSSSTWVSQFVIHNHNLKTCTPVDNHGTFLQNIPEEYNGKVKHLPFSEAPEQKDQQN